MAPYTGLPIVGSPFLKRINRIYWDLIGGQVSLFAPQALLPPTLPTSLFLLACLPLRLSLSCLPLRPSCFSCLPLRLSPYPTPFLLFCLPPRLSSASVPTPTSTSYLLPAVCQRAFTSLSLRVSQSRPCITDPSLLLPSATLLCGSDHPF